MSESALTDQNLKLIDSVLASIGDARPPSGGDVSQFESVAAQRSGGPSELAPLPDPPVAPESGVPEPLEAVDFDELRGELEAALARTGAEPARQQELTSALDAVGAMNRVLDTLADLSSSVPRGSYNA